MGPEIKHTTSLKGQPNFRDLGGYKTTEGRSIKQGLLFRSGELCNLTDEETKRLKMFKTVVDLRSQWEIDYRGQDALPSSVERIHLPIGNSKKVTAFYELLMQGNLSGVTQDKLVDIYIELYKELIFNFKTIKEFLVNASKYPIVFHCTHGKDRTGILAALILLILDVQWETIKEDYLLSNILRQKENEKDIKQIVSLISKKKKVDSNDVDIKSVLLLFNLEPVYIESIHGEILKKYKTMKNFITVGLGFNKQILNKLKNFFLY